MLAWDSTTFPKGLYSTSITLDESRGGPLSKVMLDFLINTDTFLGAAPQFDVPPTPTNAQVFNLTGGNLFTTTIQCSDTDFGDLVTIGHLGLPPGATLSPTNAIGNPATLDIQLGTGDAAQYHGIQVRVLDDGGPIMSDDGTPPLADAEIFIIPEPSFEAMPGAGLVLLLILERRHRAKEARPTT